MGGFLVGLFFGAVGGFVITSFIFLDYLEDRDNDKRH